MLRTALLRSTRAIRSVAAVRTYATPAAAHPTATSTSTSTSVSAQLAPGQEIDPQRTSEVCLGMSLTVDSRRLPTTALHQLAKA
jgi:hypothetical protein